MTTEEIQQAIGELQVNKGHNPVVANLSFLTIAEMDIMSLSNAGFMYEFEVKISRADYKKDSEKKKKHTLLQMGIGDIPNYFHYVCPEGLIKGHEVPKYAGLIYVFPNEKNEIKTHEVIKAPLLHSNKFDPLAVYKKCCRVHSERVFLGGCKLTVKNNKIKSKREDVLRGAGFSGDLLKNALKSK